MVAGIASSGVASTLFKFHVDIKKRKQQKTLKLFLPCLREGWARKPTRHGVRPCRGARAISGTSPAMAGLSRQRHRTVLRVCVPDLVLPIELQELLGWRLLFSQSLHKDVHPQDLDKLTEHDMQHFELDTLNHEFRSQVDREGVTIIATRHASKPISSPAVPAQCNSTFKTWRGGCQGVGNCANPFHTRVAHHLTPCLHSGGCNAFTRGIAKHMIRLYLSIIVAIWGGNKEGEREWPARSAPTWQQAPAQARVNRSPS